ncbi:hypothetical protein D3C78_1439980 [compost metagenome]
MRGFRAFPGLGDDIHEQARAGNGFPLPEIADGPGDRARGVEPGDVVRIGHQQRRGGQHLAIFRGVVADLQLPVRPCVETWQQGDGDIVELQSLDTRQPVDTVGTDDGVAVKIYLQVGHRDHVIGEIQRGVVVVDLDLVVVEVPREHRRVVVEASGLHHLTNDDQLPGVDRAGQHVRD